MRRISQPGCMTKFSTRSVSPPLGPRPGDGLSIVVAIAITMLLSIP